MIKYIKLEKNYKLIKKKFFKNIDKIFKNGDYILGKKVVEFENKIKKFTNSKYCVTCANGSDALEIALKLVGVKKGDEVLTVSNTFVSAVNAIRSLEGVPVFVEIDSSLNINPDDIIKKINKKTKCIILVHLNGMPCCMKKICKISKKYNIKIIEDCSQAIGSKYNNIHVGNFGDIGTFSLHPTKNLGLFGDGGFIITNKKKLFNKIKIIRNHGLKNRDLVTLEGRNSRLDNLQAIVGILNLSNLNNIIKQRNVNANIYNQNFKKYEKFIKIPNLECCGKIKHTYHRYVIRCRFRNKLKNFLNTKKIETKIHYPVNLHQQKPFKKYYRHNLPVTNKFNKQILSLPIHEHITKKEIFYIIKNVKNFYNKYTTSK